MAIFPVKAFNSRYPVGPAPVQPLLGPQWIIPLHWLGAPQPPQSTSHPLIPTSHFFPTAGRRQQLRQRLPGGGTAAQRSGGRQVDTGRLHLRGQAWPAPGQELNPASGMAAW